MRITGKNGDILNANLFVNRIRRDSDVNGALLYSEVKGNSNVNLGGLGAIVGENSNVNGALLYSQVGAVKSWKLGDLCSRLPAFLKNIRMPGLNVGAYTSNGSVGGALVVGLFNNIKRTEGNYLSVGLLNRVRETPNSKPKYSALLTGKLDFGREVPQEIHESA